MRSEIIKNIDHVDIGSNEILINTILNRNLKKLYDNDMNLLGNMSDSTIINYRVLPYVKGRTYRKNELVWFVDVNTPKGPVAEEEFYKLSASLNPYSDDYYDNLEELKQKYFTVTLYLLRSLKNNNTNVPQRTFVNMIPLFDASGWKNENPLGSIYTDYFKDWTAYNLSVQLEKVHETIEEYHKFGKLSSYSDLDDHVLKTDLTNIDPSRSNIFFPNTTTYLDETDTIVEGTMRKWDGGLLEYDITYKLGDTNSTYETCNPDGSLRLVNDLDSNYLDLKPAGLNINEFYEYDNRRYYLNDSDSDIFKILGGKNININGIIQHNVSTKINTFLGTIRLPEAFKDTNYMIFNTMEPCVMYEDGTDLEANVNKIVFVNKARQSVTALLIIPTYSGNMPKALANNTFKCQMIGRWK